MERYFFGLLGSVLALPVLASDGSAISKGPYVHLGYSVFYQSFESEGGLLEPETVSVTDLPKLRSSTIDLSFGYSFNQFLALEGHLGGGVDSSTKGVMATTRDDISSYTLEADLSAEIKNWVGLYVKPQMPLGPLNGYVLLGYAFTDMNMNSVYTLTTTDASGSPETTSGRGRISQSDSGFSYGVGISDKISDNWLVSLEYKRLPNIGYEGSQTQGEMDGWSLSLGYHY